MIKLVFIGVESRKIGERAERRFRLFEKCAGEFTPAADSQIRPGVIDDSPDLKVITDSVLLIPDGVEITFKLPNKLPEGFDSENLSPLCGSEVLFAREQLGLSPCKSI